MILRQAFAAIALAATAGCAPTFGSYSVENISLVQAPPELERPAWQGSRLARIELASDFDVTEGERNSLYVFADTCPFERKPAFGDDGRPLEAAALTGIGPFSLDGEELGPRSVIAPGTDGLFRYVIYLPVESEAWQRRFAGQSEACVVITRPQYPKERVSEPIAVRWPIAGD